MAQRNAATSSQKADLADPHAPQRIEVTGPFGGYVPNLTGNVVGVGIDSGLLDFRAATQLVGFVPCGEDLAPDYGWQRQSEDMPLGGYHTGGEDAPSDVGQPIVHIVFVPSAVSPNGVEENLVVTAKTDTANGTIWQYPKYNEDNVWYGMPSVAGTATGGTDAILTTSREVWDSAVYLPGHTVLLCDGIGINYENQPIGQLRYYTGQKWRNFPRPSGVATGFGCVSLCTHQDRVLVLATTEDGNPHTNRIRWTTAGWSTALTSPIVLPTVTTPATLLWNDAGAGALDIEEDVGAGVAIREARNKIIVYFKKGIVILERTGVYTRPYQRKIITTRRGLLGTQAITDLGDGVHFGVFSDGWFFVSEDGQFKEAGTTQIQGTTVRKWANAFYDRLNQYQAYRTIVTYEPSRHFIKIAFPDGVDSTAPNTVWTYDIYGDRVWPDNYHGAVNNNNPLCWGETIVGGAASGSDEGALHTSWDATTGIWDAPGSWDTLNPPVWGGNSVYRKLLTHGTEDGILFQHISTLYTRDGEAPSFNYVSSPQAMGDNSQFKQFQQFLLHYLQVSGSATSSPVTISLLDGTTNEVVTSHTINLTSNGTMLPKVVQTWFRNPLVQVQVSISGTHPFVLRGFDLQWLPNMGDVR